MGDGNGDLQGVVRVAALLRVSEFEVFRLAYRQWFGQLPREPALKAPFQVYLCSATVPAWVRAFVRQVLSLQREGRLDPGAFGIQPQPPATPASILTGIVAFLALCLVVALMVALVVDLQVSLPVRCTLPPCY